ncbi:ubiquitin thioesterase DG1039 [Biomphalaria glabrata]|nr:ubiquitin thioesterase DG1039 [Biomphalaria glabrata]
MPKSPSRTSKKKKYNARFPPARIKKIMQTDEDVGKVAAAVPVIISRALEMFIESLITETAKTTIARNAKTLSSSHIKQTIETNKQFDFLRDLVANVPDHQVEDTSADIPVNDAEPTSKKGRGRPKKVKDGCSSKKPKGESSKASSDTSEEEDEDEEDEDTETDEESSAGYSVTPPYVRNSDRLGQSAEPPNSTATPNAFMNNIHNTNTNFAPFFTNPALSSLHKQQQLLQPHEQFQQFPGPTLPFQYSPYVSTPLLGVANYPIPPQYSNTLPLMPHQQQPPAHSQQLQHFQEQTNGQQQQQQPINLSFSSWAMATTAGEIDDYDT